MTGTITQRGKKSWRLKFDLERDALTGKRRTVFKTVHGTRKDAEKALRDELHRVDEGAFVEQSKVTLAGYLTDKWLPFVASQVSAKTAERYRGIVTRNIGPAIGAVALQKLSPIQIQGFYADALATGRIDGKGGLSALTVCHVHRVLHSALRQATRWQIIARNPCEAVTPPRPKKTEAVSLTEEELVKLLQFAKESDIFAPVFLASTTGMRRGEVLGLRWRDVDLDTGRVSVAQVVEQTKAGITFKEPKTARSRRTIALPGVTVDALRRHRAKIAEFMLATGQTLDPAALVFCDHEGKPLSPVNFTKKFMRLVTRAGVPAIGFHGLRHTHASILLHRGTHPKLVSERLGHASIAITLDTYSHALPNMQDELAKNLDMTLRTALER